jgi:hypothetical protein
MRPIFLLLSLVALLEVVEAEPAYQVAPATVVTFELYSREEAVLLDPALTNDSPALHFSLRLLNVSSSAALRAAINTALYGGQTAEAYGERTFSSYKEEYTEAYVSGEEIPESANWDYTETVETLPASPKTVQLSQSREYYTGGAHGMREKQYFVFDVESAKQLVLTDLIKDGTQPRLLRILEAALRADTGLEPNDPLSEGAFFNDTLEELPDNFFFSAEGLGFYWNLYEIAPYVSGAFETIVPFSALKDIFNERGAAFAADFGRSSQ